MCFNNCRPVSLLCILSKVFEKIMHARLISFLEVNKILIQHQFGFRKKCSTYVALNILMDKLIKSLENGDYMIGVFLDFSKAFDTVDHDILLKKSYHYGIRDTTFKWFQSYLTERKQYVSYNDTKSVTKTEMLSASRIYTGSAIVFFLFISMTLRVFVNIPCLFCLPTIAICSLMVMIYYVLHRY